MYNANVWNHLTSECITILFFKGLSYNVLFSFRLVLYIFWIFQLFFILLFVWIFSALLNLILATRSSQTNARELGCYFFLFNLLQWFEMNYGKYASEDFMKIYVCISHIILSVFFSEQKSKCFTFRERKMFLAPVSFVSNIHTGNE